MEHELAAATGERPREAPFPVLYAAHAVVAPVAQGSACCCCGPIGPGEMILPARCRGGPADWVRIGGSRRFSRKSLQMKRATKGRQGSQTHVGYVLLPRTRLWPNIPPTNIAGGMCQTHTLAELSPPSRLLCLQRCPSSSPTMFQAECRFWSAPSVFAGGADKLVPGVRSSGPGGPKHFKSHRP